MAKRKRLSNIRVDKISLVDAGDDPEARIVLVKRRARVDRDEMVRRRFTPGRHKGSDKAKEPEPASEAEAMAMAVGKRLVGEPSEALVKFLLFDEVMEIENQEEILEMLFERVEALVSSLECILLYPDDEGRDPESMVAETLEQFSDTVTSEVAGMFAGAITKRIESEDLEEGDLLGIVAEVFEEVAKAAADSTSQSSATGAGDTEEDEMSKQKIDLSKLDEKTRKGVEKALADQAEAIGKAEELTKAQADQIAELTAKVASLETEDAEADDDPLAKIKDVGTRELVKSLLDDKQALEKRVAAQEHVAKREALAKRVEFKHLATPQEELVDALIGCSAETVDKIVPVLKAADEAASKAFTTLGSDEGDDSGGGRESAQAQIDQLAKQYREADPKLTEAAALSKVYEDREDLYLQIRKH